MKTDLSMIEEFPSELFINSSQKSCGVIRKNKPKMWSRDLLPDIHKQDGMASYSIQANSDADRYEILAKKFSWPMSKLKVRPFISPKQMWKMFKSNKEECMQLRKRLSCSTPLLSTKRRSSKTSGYWKPPLPFIWT